MNCRQPIVPVTSTDHWTRFGRDAHSDVCTGVWSFGGGRPPGMAGTGRQTSTWPTAAWPA